MPTNLRDYGGSVILRRARGVGAGRAGDSGTVRSEIYTEETKEGCLTRVQYGSCGHVRPQILFNARALPELATHGFLVAAASVSFRFTFSALFGSLKNTGRSNQLNPYRKFYCSSVWTKKRLKPFQRKGNETCSFGEKKK
jgi:hypothetical protein